jgi:transcriptional regulator with XRE-family HTH domain
MATNNSSRDWYSMSDPAIVKELCSILRQVRLQQNITQDQLAEQAGLSRSAISKMETGKSTVEFLTLIQVLRSLQQLHLLDPWQVSATVSPLLMAKLKAKSRKRASGAMAQTDKEESEW